jgi:NAD(P)-dependent dehydrogenase (short-subunit alcohol dehydrogenase family)
MAHSWANIDFENLNGEKYYNGEEAYALSKLCNILFTYKLSRFLKEKKITVNALHPGVIGTKLLRAGWGMGGAPIEKGAETSLYLAASDEVENVSGKYFSDKHMQKSSAISYDENLQEQLWKMSDEMIERKNFYIG